MSTVRPDVRSVAFQGYPGAYSHMACDAACPNVPTHPCSSFDAVFDSVELRQADLAMIPVENSQAGRVADIHRLLPERSLRIIAEHYQPVDHHLLVVPGTRPDQIRTVRSHPQALAQCRHYLRSRGYEPQAASDTAGAARDVAMGGDPSVAAIASAMAGQIYGLDAADRGIQDSEGNTTRFLLMSRDGNDPGATQANLVTSCLFRVRNIPAALFKALGGFATNNVNLLKLESYQMGGAFAWTQFAIDFEGHPEHTHVAHALEELQFFSDELRVLGTYPAHPFRLERARLTL